MMHVSPIGQGGKAAPVLCNDPDEDGFNDEAQAVQWIPPGLPKRGSSLSGGVCGFRVYLQLCPPLSPSGAHVPSFGEGFPLKVIQPKRDPGSFFSHGNPLGIATKDGSNPEELSNASTGIPFW